MHKNKAQYKSNPPQTILMNKAIIVASYKNPCNYRLISKEYPM